MDSGGRSVGGCPRPRSARSCAGGSALVSPMSRCAPSSSPGSSGDERPSGRRPAVRLHRSAGRSCVPRAAGGVRRCARRAGDELDVRPGRGVRRVPAPAGGLHVSGGSDPAGPRHGGADALARQPGLPSRTDDDPGVPGRGQPPVGGCPERGGVPDGMLSTVYDSLVANYAGPLSPAAASAVANRRAYQAWVQRIAAWSGAGSLPDGGAGPGGRSRHRSRQRRRSHLRRRQPQHRAAEEVHPLRLGTGPSPRAGSVRSGPERFVGGSDHGCQETGSRPPSGPAPFRSRCWSVSISCEPRSMSLRHRRRRSRA